MEERNIEITKHLQKRDAQKRILERMQRARSEATVTISNAAHLFGFSENQLRDWDDKGLLKPQRPTQDTTQDGKNTKRRQYTPAELDKLAIIRELIDAGYSPGSIPPYVDEIWASVAGSTEQQLQSLIAKGSEIEHLYIDQRIERMDKEVFWRYFVSQALRLSLMLICEDIPDTPAGLVLPLEKKDVPHIVRDTKDLPEVGPSLIGWSGRNRSFYTFIDSTPSFEYVSDFRVQPLIMVEENIPQHNTLVVVQRKTPSLNLSALPVETIRRLLEPIYKNVDKWRPCFDYGMRDWLYQVTDFMSSPNTPDDVLDGLADMIVQLGGKTSKGQDRWRFCCILLPKDVTLPMQQRSLVVRAQSEYSPHKVGITTVSVSPDKHVDSLTLRAFQSGHVIYRTDTSNEDSTIIYGAKEGTVRSAIAIPVGGEDGLSAGVIYIVSDEVDAFSENDRRILRIISRMVEELLLTYRVRWQGTGKLADLITTPDIVDITFSDFLSENDLVSAIQALLTDIHRQSEAGHSPEGAVAFIAIDIDNQSGIANKYGDRVARNLSKNVGGRIQGQLRAFTNPSDRRLYHVYADRFYLMLKDTPLEVAQKEAEQLRLVLRGDYRVDARDIPTDRPRLPAGMLELSRVTVRLAVTWYEYKKLEELLCRYSTTNAIASVTSLLMRSLDEVLDLGQREGGDVVMSWNPKTWGYERLLPQNLE